MRRDLHDWLKPHLATHPEGRTDAAFLGIDPDPRRGFEVHTARFALRPGPDGDIDAQLLGGILQDMTIPGDPNVPGSQAMTFQGGSTIIGDLRRLKFRYCVRKNVASVTRQAQQRAFAATSLESPKTTYFGTAETLEPFAAMHRATER
jgi:hypothetical protein